jgi:hypothetical protein
MKWGTRALTAIVLFTLCNAGLKAEISVGKGTDFIEIEGPVVFMQQPSLQVGGFGERIGQLGAAHTVAVDRFGNFYVVDDLRNTVKVWSYYTMSSAPLETISSDTIESAGLGPLAGVQAISTGVNNALLQATRLYLLERHRGRVPKSRILMRPYLFSNQWIQLPFTAFLQTPHDLTVDVSGRLVISESGGIVEVLLADGSGRDNRFGEEGIRDLGEIDGLATSTLVAVDSDSEGNIHIADKDHGRIIKLDPSGNVLRVFGGRGDGEHQFRGPIEGVAVDWRGNAYGRDALGDAYLVYAPDGRFLTRLGDNGFDSHQQRNANGFAIDRSSRRFIIADDGNYRVSVHKMTRGQHLSRIYTRYDIPKITSLKPATSSGIGTSVHDLVDPDSGSAKIPASHGTQ